MKSFKSILAMIAMLLLLGSTAMANTLVVKADGSGAYTKLEDAVAAAVPNDIIEIQDNAVYDIKSTLVLNGVTLRGAEGFQPTIKNTGTTANVDAIGYLITMTDSAIQNLKLIGKYKTGAWPADWQMAAFVHGSFDIKKCFFQDFQASALSFVSVKGKLLTGTMSYCYTVNCADRPIYFEDRTPAGEEKSTSADIGTMLFDHNTLLSRGWIMALAASFPSNGGTITAKNNIMGNFVPEATWGFGNTLSWGLTNPFVTEWPVDGQGNPVAGSHPTNDFIHSYNAYLGVWMFKWNWQDIDYNSMNYQNDIGPTELGTTNQQVMDVGFVDALHYDLTLKPSSKLIGKGENNSTIGAYQSPTPAGPQFVVKQDGTGDFTTIEAAVAKATYGDLIEIGDSATYDLAADVKLAGISLRGAADQTPVIKHTTGGDAGRLINEVNDATLSNLTLVAHATENQMGMAGGSHFVVKNVTFKNFKLDSCMILGPTPTTKLYGEISSCYFVDCGANAITFAGWGGPSSSNLGSFLIDHNTFVCSGGPFIYIANGYPSSGGLVTVKNNIFAAYTSGAYVAAKPFGAEVLAKVKFVHSYNLFNKLDSTGFGFALNTANELQDKDPLFIDIAAGNLKVKESAPASPAANAGEGGSTIGAYQAQAPNAAKSWTVFE